MNRNPRAIMTLIRNRLGGDPQEVYQWFNEKGVQIKQEGEYYFLKSNKDANSEISHACNGVVFRNHRLLVWPGYIVPEMTLKEAREDKHLIWNDDTFWTQYVPGKRVYMFWDTSIEKWNFSDPAKLNSNYSNILKRGIQRVMSLDPSYTYSFIVSEEGESAGVYLDTMYHTATMKEQDWETTYKNSVKIKCLHPKLYKFEGFDKLEDSDFPLYMRDKSENKVLITGL